MGVVALLDVEEELAAAIRGRRGLLRLVELPAAGFGESRTGHLHGNLDAVVVGARVGDPIQMAQRTYRMDPMASVVILGDAEQCRRIHEALRFAPLVGSDVRCEALDGAAAEPVERAAERARTRRKHRETLGALDLRLAQRERPAAAPTEHYVARLVDVAPIGIVSLDASGRIVSANAEASRLLGVDERALLGERLDEAPPGGPALRGLLEDAGRLGRAGPVLAEGGGEPALAIEARAVTVEGPLGHGLLLLLQDVTERLAAERAREAAARRLEEANRLKDEFLAMLSHELRTPLSAILGWSRMLRSGQIPPEKRARALEVIERNATAQVALIEDLLDVSRIASGKMRLDLAPVALRDVVEQAVLSARPAADGRRIRLETALDGTVPPLTGDADRLQQVAWNLISNAVKFTDPGGLVRVGLEREDDAVVLRVEDTGSGIAAEELPHVFDPFRQAEGGTTRVHGGLGLGLSIVKRLVEMHGGEIEARSAGKGKGATFVARLPLVLPGRVASDRPAAPAPEKQAPSVSSAERPLAGRRVLVTEDDDDARDLVATILREAGADVALAASAGEALTALARQRFDLLVSDVGMPGEDGYSLARRLRELPAARGGRTPALALTAFARREDKRRALAAGFDAHASKPIEPDLLLQLAVELTLGEAG